MKIKSSFSDYYDHIVHLYGSDPSITYIRNRIVPRTEYGSGQLSIHNMSFSSLPKYELLEYSFKWLVVVGKYYLLVRRNGELCWSIVSEKKHPTLWKWLDTPRRWAREQKFAADYVGKFSDKLVTLSRNINAPVFVLEETSRENWVVDGDIPNLGELGMAKIIPPEQIYQDISYFMGNIIKESPDVSPPTKMTDKEKIIQHGFDNRISFRHRV